MKWSRQPNDHAILRSPLAGPKMIRGGAIRTVGYATGVLLTIPTSALILRHLGVTDFGRYVTVTALLGIVAGITDLGLTTVASRELAVERDEQRRRELLSTFLVLRLGTAALGVLVAVLFALGVGYDRTMVFGTLIAGVAVLLLAPQAVLILPLWISLRIGTLTLIELLRPTLLLIGVIIAIGLGGSVLALFAVLACVSVLVLVATVGVLGGEAVVRPSLDRTRIARLSRTAAPVAVATSVHYLYFGSLVVVVSLVGTQTDTGLFGTSFRIFEILLTLPALALGVTFPVLSVAGAEDEARLRFGLQRVVEVGLLLGALLAVLVAILAEPVIELLGGEDFGPAGSVLRIQGLALIPIFASQALAFTLIAIRKDHLLIAASGTGLLLALALGFALVPVLGAEGAAWAGVTAEVAICVILFTCIAKVRPQIRPSVRFAWKSAVCAGIAASTLGLPSLSPWVRAVIAASLYVGAALALRAVPAEVLTHLVPRRRPFAKTVPPPS